VDVELLILSGSPVNVKAHRGREREREREKGISSIFGIMNVLFSTIFQRHFDK